MAYRILVTGSRNWDDRQKIYDILDEIADANDGIILVHGDCPTGADKMADDWAQARAIWCEQHPAEWVVDGKFRRQAGYIRNAEMVGLGADICVAFIKNGSFGSTSTADLAEKKGIKTIRYLA